jgi:hypothetical protein
MERDASISLDAKFQPIPMYHDKDYDTSWYKNLEIGHKNYFNQFPCTMTKIIIHLHTKI